MTPPSSKQPGEMADLVAGLGRVLDGHGRRLDELAGLSDQLRDLGVLVASLAEHTSPPQGRRPTAAVTWLGFAEASSDPAAQATTRAHLTSLVEWMDAVYLRYAGASQSLSDCWLWHPDVVEELTWLRAAWLHAYVGSAATPLAAGDWHDRQRPGVVRRLKAVATSCSLENHEPTSERGLVTNRAPLGGCVARIADWWATCRRECPPAPSGADDRGRGW